MSGEYFRRQPVADHARYSSQSSCKSGGRSAFMIRLVLAATLGANYGIYGPAFELCENAAAAPGSEEYPLFGEI